MSKPRPTPRSSRPGGRTEMVKQVVAARVLEFIEQGKLDFSYNELAEHSGIHKTTLYRRWPARIDLLREAVKHHNQSFQLPCGDSWHEASASIVKNTAIFFCSPIEMAINKALLSDPDAESNALDIEDWAPIYQQLIDLVDAAKDRGELPRQLDSAVLLKTIMSPLLVESLICKGAIKRQFINDLITVARSYSLVAS